MDSDGAVNTRAAARWLALISGVGLVLGVTTGAASATGTEDTTPPEVEAISPADGAVYAVGSDVRAAYRCWDEEALAMCVATDAAGDPPIRPGDRIDTSTPGSYEFWVVAQDQAGNWAETVARYTVTDCPADGLQALRAPSPLALPGRPLLSRWIDADLIPGLATVVAPVADLVAGPLERLNCDLIVGLEDTIDAHTSSALGVAVRGLASWWR